MRLNLNLRTSNKLELLRSDYHQECTFLFRSQQFEPIFSIIIIITMMLSFIDKRLVKREREQGKRALSWWFFSAVGYQIREGLRAVENVDEQSDKREKREPYTFEGWSFWRASSREAFVRSTAASSIPSSPHYITLQMHIICIIIRSTFHAVVKAATLSRTVDETRGKEGSPDYQLR